MYTVDISENFIHRLWIEYDDVGCKQHSFEYWFSNQFNASLIRKHPRLRNHFAEKAITKYCVRFPNEQAAVMFLLRWA